MEDGNVAVWPWNTVTIVETVLDLLLLRGSKSSAPHPIHVEICFGMLNTRTNQGQRKVPREDMQE